ncbi:fructose-1-phosphate kinase [Coriobacterium glomerans PW2]|uniref:1-phosphofructokinase n=1 Tax=Coriobacterium glomerans (strain ATCC 49209 / DSM 20642 / JCM 10262 / PW2) TaxID=700015 RepID=F2N726_CORGP|nr:1-phosphofructokinase [Coriobacterium glomerans]AEB06365.1 fructose-1-phosphate kinase [Coriobacterium glomerans PW2]
MIYTVTLNPALDKTVLIESFTIDAVNRVVGCRIDPGGKGINVSKAIAKLGGASLAFALLGGATGETIRCALDELAIPCRSFDAGGETRTNLKVADPRLHTHTDINEAGPHVSEVVLNDMLDSLVADLRAEDIVVLSGSLPEGVAPDTYALWTRACAAHGARVFLDAAGDALRYGLHAKPYLVKPNGAELEQLVGRTLCSTAEIVDAGRSLIVDGVRCVAVSLGSEGAVFLTSDTALLASAPEVRVSSTVGAGDSVVAALCHALDCDLPWREAIALSMATGAANVMSEGTQAAERALIDSLVPEVRIEQL